MYIKCCYETTGITDILTIILLKEMYLTTYVFFIESFTVVFLIDRDLCLSVFLLTLQIHCLVLFSTLIYLTELTRPKLFKYKKIIILFEQLYSINSFNVIIY